MTLEQPPDSLDNPSIPDNTIAFKKLEVEERKSDREYEIRLREMELKENEAKRSKWSSPIVLTLIAAFVAAIGNGYISWLNGENQLRLESNKNAGQIAIEQQKAEAARILEATKDVPPEKAAEKLRFLIDIGLIVDSNQQARLEKYLEHKENTTKSSGEALPIIEQYATEWLGGGNDQQTQCRIGRTYIVQKHPGKSVLLISSSEQSKKDFFGRVEYKYFCTFQVQ